MLLYLKIRAVISCGVCVSEELTEAPVCIFRRGHASSLSFEMVLMKKDTESS